MIVQVRVFKGHGGGRLRLGAPHTVLPVVGVRDRPRRATGWTLAGLREIGLDVVDGGTDEVEDEGLRRNEGPVAEQGSHGLLHAHFHQRVGGVEDALDNVLHLPVHRVGVGIRRRRGVVPQMNQDSMQHGHAVGEGDRVLGRMIW